MNSQDSPPDILSFLNFILLRFERCRHAVLVESYTDHRCLDFTLYRQAKIIKESIINADSSGT